MAPHSSSLAWQIPWTEKPGRLQSMESWRVGHDWATSLSLFTFMHWRRKWQPTPVFYLENPRDGGAWWAAVYGVAQSRTWLKWLSSSIVDLQCFRYTAKWLRYTHTHTHTHIYTVSDLLLQDTSRSLLFIYSFLNLYYFIKDHFRYERAFHIF